MEQPLQDTTNMPPRSGGGGGGGAGANKRQRLEPLQQRATFELVVERAGIRGLLPAGGDGDGDGTSDASPAPPQVDDLRAVRRQLEADLSGRAAQAAFLESLADALAADELLLHKCLLPIAVTVQVSHATGDSLMRLLLNLPALQQRAATLLLRKLPEFTPAEWGTDVDEGGGRAAAAPASSVPSLILGQLRWLEVVVDAPALTAAVLEVLPLCSPPIQQQLIGFLPEVVEPQDQQAVLEQLRSLLDGDLAFTAAVLDCVSNMQLQDGRLQDDLLSWLLALLPAVEVEDLPALVKHLLSAAAGPGGAGAGGAGGGGGGSADKVVAALRSALHFASPSDPRMAVPDRKQKGAARPSPRCPEALLARELVGALQASDAAAAAALKLVGGLREPAAHRCFDLLVLLALHARGGASRKAAESCLRTKLLEGRATPDWISRVLQGRQAAFRDLCPSLLLLAESWSRAREAPLCAAASAVYVDLFVGAASALERQQVLQALHGHLGSGQPREQDAALQALGCLAWSHRQLLGRYSSYLSNVLDHLEGFSNERLQRLFAVFAALTATQPGDAGPSSSSGATQGGGGGGGRLEDELSITLSKALAQSCPGYKRIGVVGTLALLRQGGADYALVADSADDQAAASLHAAWLERANALFAQCTGQPGALAFALDQWAEVLEQPQGLGDRLPLPMLEWLSDRVTELLNGAFLADLAPPGASLQASEEQAATPPPLQPDVPLDDATLEARLLLNLDGNLSPVYVQILPLAASRDASKRAALVWLPPAMRLLAAVSQQLTPGSLSSIDALLGCPLALPAPAMFVDGRWETLPLPSKVVVLCSLQHGICWLREVVAVFAPLVSSEVLLARTGAGNSQNEFDETQNKLLARLSQLRQVEALFKHLVASCPAAAQQLPDLSCPLLLAAAGEAGGGWARSAAAAALAANKPPAGAGASGGGGKAAAAPAFGPPDAMARLRCLRPDGVQALNTCQPPNMLLTSLLPAAHLAADLHCKLKVLAARARRPPGFPAGGAAGTAAAAGLPGLLAPGGGGGAPGMPGGGAAGPPCLQGATLQGVVRSLAPLLPALQQHLQTALTVIKKPPERGREVLFEGLPGAASQCEAPLLQLAAVAEASEALPAAHALAMSCLQCFTLLLGCSKELPDDLLRIVLEAWAQRHDAGQGGAAAEQRQAQALLVAAFKSARRLSCLNTGRSTLELELGVLSLLQAVVGLAAAQGMPAQNLAEMGAKLCGKADALLRESWSAADEADEDGGAGAAAASAAAGRRQFTWRGQAAAISQLLGVLVGRAADPSQQLERLVREVLPLVAGRVPAKEALAPAGGYASLCSVTFATWYRVVFEQLVDTWDKLVAAGLRMAAKPAGGGGRGGGRGAAPGRGGGARRQQPPGSQEPPPPDWDDYRAEELMGQAQRCCAALRSLVELSQKHESRNGVLAAAVKLCGQFIDGMLRGMPFWRQSLRDFTPEFTALVRDVQGGARVVQIICNEGKARGAGSLLSRAPAAKRSLERFVFEIKAFFHEAGRQDAVVVSTFKLRDLAGNSIGSQMYPGGEEDEDPGEGEELGDAYDDEDDEDGGGGGGGDE